MSNSRHNKKAFMRKAYTYAVQQLIPYFTALVLWPHLCGTLLRSTRLCEVRVTLMISLS